MKKKSLYLLLRIGCIWDKIRNWGVQLEGHCNNSSKKKLCLGNGRGGTKCFNSIQYSLKIEPTGFLNRLLWDVMKNAVAIN